MVNKKKGKMPGSGANGAQGSLPQESEDRDFCNCSFWKKPILGTCCCYPEKFKTGNCFEAFNVKKIECLKNTKLFILYRKDSVNCKQIYILVHENN